MAFDLFFLVLLLGACGLSAGTGFLYLRRERHRHHLTEGRLEVLTNQLSEALHLSQERQTPSRNFTNGMFSRTRVLRGQLGYFPLRMTLSHSEERLSLRLSLQMPSSIPDALLLDFRAPSPGALAVVSALAKRDPNKQALPIIMASSSECMLKYQKLSFCWELSQLNLSWIKQLCSLAHEAAHMLTDDPSLPWLRQALLQELGKQKNQRVRMDHLWVYIKQFHQDEALVETLTETLTALDAFPVEQAHHSSHLLSYLKLIQHPQLKALCDWAHEHHNPDLRLLAAMFTEQWEKLAEVAFSQREEPARRQKAFSHLMKALPQQSAVDWLNEALCSKSRCLLQSGIQALLLYSPPLSDQRAPQHLYQHLVHQCTSRVEQATLSQLWPLQRKLLSTLPDAEQWPQLSLSESPLAHVLSWLQNTQAQGNAAQLIRQIGDPAFEPLLLGWVESRDENVAVLSCMALVTCGTLASVSTLHEVGKRWRDSHLKRAARHAINVIQERAQVKIGAGSLSMSARDGQDAKGTQGALSVSLEQEAEGGLSLGVELCEDPTPASPLVPDLDSQ